MKHQIKKLLQAALANMPAEVLPAELRNVEVELERTRDPARREIDAAADVFSFIGK